MTSHGSAAKMAREMKEKNPERYCPASSCLWRTGTFQQSTGTWVGGGRCPRHGGEAKANTAPRLPVAGERVEYRAGFESPVYRGTATGKPCDDGTCGYVHVIEDERGLHHVDPSYFLKPGVATKWARAVVPSETSTKGKP